MQTELEAMKSHCFKIEINSLTAIEFMFQMTKDELENLMSQIVISKQGVYMLSAVLKSDTVIKIKTDIIAQNFSETRGYVVK